MNATGIWCFWYCPPQGICLEERKVYDTEMLASHRPAPVRSTYVQQPYSYYDVGVYTLISSVGKRNRGTAMMDLQLFVVRIPVLGVCISSLVDRWEMSRMRHRGRLEVGRISRLQNRVSYANRTCPYSFASVPLEMN